ncbi:MAG: hypothetical protein RR086_00850 [Clostridia bacterium]
MVALLKEGFLRVIHSKWFRIILIVNVSICVFLLLTIYGLADMLKEIINTTGGGIPGFGDENIISLFSLQAFIKAIGALGSVELTLVTIGIAKFICDDFSDGTIRNKILAGKERAQIYLSNTIVSITLFFVMGLSSLVIYLTLGNLLMGFNGSFGEVLSEITATMGLQLVISLFWISLVIMVSMLTRKASTTLIVVLLIEFLLPGILSFLLSIVSLGGTSNWASEVLNNWIPFGQSSSLMLWPIQNSLAYKVLLVNIPLIGIFNVWGFVAFNKADIK